MAARPWPGEAMPRVSAYNRRTMRGLLDLPDLHHPVANLLAEQLDQVALIFERQLASDLSAVNSLCVHIERYRGKMLRPTLVLVSGMASAHDSGSGASLTEQHRTVAAVVEMIHMATLVHDDVLDEAEMRRNGSTVNHLWGNEAAVMLGDYLISNAFHLCSSIGNPAVNLALGGVTNTLCEGELVQLHHRNNYGIDEATYFEIVRRKTASLIGECCRLGAHLSQADEAIAESLRRFGCNLGIAFQVQDDLLDLVGDEDVVGKSLGRDLEKGKLTLPLTHLMSGAGPEERSELLTLIEHRDAAAIRRRLIDAGSVEYARERAQQFVLQAKDELAPLRGAPVGDLLLRLADMVVAREF